MLYTIYSPLEQFEIQTLIQLDSPISIISSLSITTFSLYAVFTLLLIVVLSTLPFQYIKSNRGISIKNNKIEYVKINQDKPLARIIPTGWTLSVEALYSTINSMVSAQIGRSAQHYFPFVFSIFLLILVSNLLSLVPANFALNAQLIFTIGLSMTIWIGNTLLGLSKQGFGFFALFVPAGCSLPLVPVLVLIESLSYIARAISLGLRLGSNILAGHLLLVILCGLTLDFMSSSIICLFLGILPLGLILGIMCLESAIAGIQAYVFSILTCSYIKDALFAH